MKTCKKCKEEKPLDQFWTDRRNKCGRGARCKKCLNEENAARNASNPIPNRERAKTWHARNPERSRLAYKKKHIRTAYGLELDQVSEMIEKQNGECAICGEKQSSEPWKTLAVDHCHETNIIRGMLCHKCNKGLGMFRDNPELLELAAAYLRNPPKPLGETKVRPKSSTEVRAEAAL